MERTAEKETLIPLSDHFQQLLELEPKLVTDYVPKDAAVQKSAFLKGEIRNPHHTYDRLDAINFEERGVALEQASDNVLGAPDLNPKFASAYEGFVSSYQKRTRLLELAHDYNHAQDEEKPAIREEYMQLNIELYGQPDETVYRSLLQERLAEIGSKELDGKAAELRDELFRMTGFTEAAEVPERFKPSGETIEWMGGVVHELYDGMLAHVPEEKESFTIEEVRTVFRAIIAEEFGEAAEEWQVDIEAAKAINVKATEKRIVLPEDRGDISKEQLRGLVVHELGVHMLRAVIGGETDLEPLVSGMDAYYDAEEGLGVVMEQALKGEFREAGADHYITAGLAYYDGMDFRDAFEVKWRLALLSKLDNGQDVVEADLTKAQNTAYGSTLRTFRGTDELPWFKDLAYYNGAVSMWHHLEKIRGDDLQFTFVLLGKSDPASKAHERVVYETSSK